MPGKDLHAQPFTEETLAKLRIFENYTQEWIPTFVMSGFPEICIFDFFAGTGYDKIGIPGSPIRILEQVAKNNKILFDKNTKVNLYFNEFITEKYERLVLACKSFIDNSPALATLDKTGKLNISYFNRDFAELFQELLPTIQSEASLVFLDQNGIKFIGDEFFIPLTYTQKTDFLYFIASSYANRFKDTGEFKKYIDFKPTPDENGSYNNIHNELVAYLKQRIPLLSGVKLYPFSIKKGRNIYGIVFGSSHPRGVEKFLRTAWKENPENGEANFDIHNDELGTIDLFEGRKLSKIELFQSEFEKEVLNGRIRNNQQAFDFTLDKGHIPQHATDVMKRLKKENRVSYLGISPKISYDYCYKKNSIEIVEYRLIK